MNLKKISEPLKYNIVKHELFPVICNPLNPTELTIIEKDIVTDEPQHVLACPKHKTQLQRIGDVFFSPEALTVYPILSGIPCLRVDNGIVASNYPEVYNLLTNCSQSCR